MEHGDWKQAYNKLLLDWFSKLQDISQDLYPVLSDSQNCCSLGFTSSNRPKSPTYKAFQTSGTPGFASTLSARLVICTHLPSKIHCGRLQHPMRFDRSSSILDRSATSILNKHLLYLLERRMRTDRPRSHKYPVARTLNSVSAVTVTVTQGKPSRCLCG
ncbi:hypothetical protein FIBSPDRAFT_860300 [Athelia psychrophila]|uniref:Uncharacterized protein n=1 Tax=Athelia psychrophila TaxID=1759441 RepID=A0A166K9L3_9AGAM|nr:hypothetical protein FIBSPDRAFT_860300 [Fibularhizoctonia sp. CBS 109695]